jgi:hypothetical protein
MITLGNNQPMLSQSLVGAVPELVDQRRDLEPDPNWQDVSKVTLVGLGIISGGAACLLTGGFTMVFCRRDRCSIIGGVLSLSGVCVYAIGVGIILLERRMNRIPF